MDLFRQQATPTGLSQLASRLPAFAQPRFERTILSDQTARRSSIANGRNRMHASDHFSHADEGSVPDQFLLGIRPIEGLCRNILHEHMRLLRTGFNDLWHRQADAGPCPEKGRFVSRVRCSHGYLQNISFVAGRQQTNQRRNASVEKLDRHSIGIEELHVPDVGFYLRNQSTTQLVQSSIDPMRGHAWSIEKYYSSRVQDAMP